MGHLEFDGVEHYLAVTEKRNKMSRKILLDAARAFMAYLQAGVITYDAAGPLFRPLTADGRGLERRHMDRKTPWRIVKRVCRQTEFNPDRLDRRGKELHVEKLTAFDEVRRKLHTNARLLLKAKVCVWSRKDSD